MEEYEEIDYYLRPTRKNHRLLGFFFLVLAILSLVLSVTECSFASTFIHPKDKGLLDPYFLSRISYYSRISVIVFGVCGYFMMTVFYWTVVSTLCFVSFVSTLFSQLFLMFRAMDFSARLISGLIMIAEICLMILFSLLLIAFIYQTRSKESRSRMSLELNDPEILIMRNLFSSVYYLVPGLSYFTKKMSSSTKAE